MDAPVQIDPQSEPKELLTAEDLLELTEDSACIPARWFGPAVG